MDDDLFVIPVVLCGGNGSRLWPLSSHDKPKQFISLPGTKCTLLQNTLLRLKEFDYLAPPILVVQQRFLEEAKEQIREINAQVTQIIAESEANGTAFAISLAISWLKQRYQSDKGLVLIMPVDHHLENSSVLFEKIEGIARHGLNKIITFGVAPQRIECEYGYLQVNDDATADDFQKVTKFIEKPTLIDLHDMMKSTFFYWNSGIFLSSIETFSMAFQAIYDELRYVAEQALCEAIEYDGVTNIGIVSLNDKRSIDYMIIEKADNIYMQFLDTKWHDIGHLHSAWELSDKDQYGNFSSGNTVLMDTQNSYIVADHKPTAVIGLNDVVVINTEEAMLVADKSCSNHVKSLYNKFNYSAKVKENRPWGNFDEIAKGSNFAVKKIKIAPSQRTSLQLHKHRSEYLVAIEGSAYVVIGNESYILKPGDGVYIPSNTPHRIANNGLSELFIIEVQTGGLISEDDIVRIQDDYGRSCN